MRKLILLFVCFLFVTVIAKADMTQNGRQPREWDQSTSQNNFLQAGKQDYTDNTSVFSNSVNTGTNATGNAGYQALMACDAANICRSYYLWVDATNAGTGGSKGTLVMASFPLISKSTSFPYGDWRASTGFTNYTKVSSQ